MIIGVTSTYHSFNAGFAFLREEEHDYIWALIQFSKHLSNSPCVITTDRELALMNALESVFDQLKIFFVFGILTKIFLRIVKTNSNKKQWNGKVLLVIGVFALNQLLLINLNQIGIYSIKIGQLTIIMQFHIFQKHG